MIERISVLHKESENSQTKTLCEKAMSTINSAIFHNIPDQARVDLERAVITDLFEGLLKIDDKPTKKWLKNTKRIWAVENLGVRDAVNFLASTEGKDNAALMEILENFMDHLAKVPEVLLYESFISAMQSFSYFPKVGNAVEDIKNRVDSYESDVSITKIIETMKRTQSAYLVPLIEDFVQDYLDNKNSITKQCLKEGLIKFSYDPFVRDIINLVAADVASLQLEYANAICDIEKVYSPVIYLGENEAIFTVKGSYYIKKGNNLSRLNKNSISKLDKDFVQLCEAMNSPNIEIDDKKISIFEGTDKAVVYRDRVVINDQTISSEQFKSSSELAHWTGKGKFLNLVRMFNENFDEIAEIDFAKRVYLKENIEYAADVFKLRGNISIATYDPKEGGGTFYRNINPIQAKNLMMEHLRFDVSKAFEELLPDEEKINEEIIETKKAYTDYIHDLESKIEGFSTDSSFRDINGAVVEALTEELNSVKNEYKDYLNIVESHVRVPLNETSISLEIDGPLTIDVGGQKYVVPIPQIKGGDSNVGLQNNLQGQQTDAGAEDSQFGTTVGDDNISNDAASAVTFDDTQSELLGNAPSIESDEIDLGADRAEADADAAEAEKKFGEDSEEGDDEGEIKIDGEEEPTEEEPSGEEAIDGGLDLDFGSEEEEDEEKAEEEPEEEKKEKIEDSTSNNDAPKKKVYLTKKKS